MDAEEPESGAEKVDRKIRKPLVEKKRRARINDSLHELRTLLADAELHSKMENAEVLEVTVRRVEDILRSRTRESDVLTREASERFAAGYIQCMHEVHMFVSTCPGIDATVAAELLNHLLECMPLNEDHLPDVLMDLIAETPGSNGVAWQGGGGEAPGSTLASPAPSVLSSEDVCSDLDETDGEHNQSSSEGVENRETCTRSMWRPW
ncbi:hairy-related 13 [Antennarius striatus]|uniref:hairy-related 13 n=1 Tax=Antennarius striatus TaxID=241820 RepID=UPI0035B08DF9